MSRHLVPRMVADARASGSSRWLRANCLACPERVGKTDSKRSFSYHSTTGFYHCKRCGLRGRAAELAGGIDLDTQHELDRLADDGARESTALPEGFFLLDEEPAKSSHNGRWARAFLDGRGITEDKRRAHGVGAVLLPGSKFYGRIVVPFRSSDGQLLGFVGRSWQKKHPLPYLYSTGLRRGEFLFGGEKVHESTDEPLLIVEGSLDAIFLGGASAAVLGKPSHEQLDILIEAKRPVVFVLDGDAWLEGYGWAQRLRAASLGQGGRGLYAALRLPGGTDPDELPPDFVFSAAREAVAQLNG